MDKMVALGAEPTEKDYNAILD